LSNPTIQRVRRTGIAIAVGCACAALPQAAQAAAIDLDTAAPFVVLGGSAVTNSGPSVLNGELGVHPGTGLSGFGAPATVNGAVHQADSVAAGAQLDVGTAYDVAAQEPSADLSSQDLGNKTLTSGGYSYTSDALLTGALTLDAQGDPNARFVIKVGSQLTTASGSSVLLINGASPCNVWWQVGTTAAIGATTVMQGNVMANASITVGNGASVTGRLLARNGNVTLINDVLDNGGCGTGADGVTTGSPTSTPTTPSTPTGGPSGGPAGTPAGDGTGIPAVAPIPARTTRRGRATVRRPPRESCTAGFRATVSGRMIRRVVFSMDGNRIRSLTRSPYSVSVRARPGVHKIRARVTFTDATRARTFRFDYRACAAQVLRPRQGPSQFTG
jgi:hypothetical protein